MITSLTEFRELFADRLIKLDGVFTLLLSNWKLICQSMIWFRFYKSTCGIMIEIKLVEEVGWFRRDVKPLIVKYVHQIYFIMSCYIQMNPSVSLTFLFFL